MSEISRSLKGAGILFMGRSEGLQYLDRSVEGFWRSFAVVLLLLPLNAITVLAIVRTNRADGTFNALFMQQMPALVLDWVAFPLALALAAGPLGISARYASYVVARNWSAPIAASIMTIPFVLQGAGWVPPAGAVVLSMIALVVVLRYHYLVVRIALGTPGPMSAGLVFADLVLSFMIIALLG